MTTVFLEDWETNNWSQWDSQSAMTISTAAALEGTYGCELVAGDFGEASVAVTLTVSAGVFRLAFRFNVNDLTLSTSEAINQAVRLTLNPSGDIIDVDIVEDGSGNLNLRFDHYNDAGTPSTVTSTTVAAGANTWEVKVTQAADSGSSDGSFTVSKNGIQIGRQSGIDNYDNFSNLTSSFLFLKGLDGGGSSGSAYLDELTLVDDDTEIFPAFSGYGLVRSSGGNMKSSIAVAADGQNIFFALEDDATGNQLVFKATRPSSPTISKVYDPAGGSAANVFASGDRNKMVFGGNFATDVVVIDHDIDAGTNTDISPSSAGSDVVSPIKVDPSNPNHIIAINKTDEDALETTDNGSNWSTLNSALGIQIVAMDAVFFGAFFPVGAVYGGNDGVDENVTYSPNDFANGREDTPAGLKAAGAITGIDLALDID